MKLRVPEQKAAPVLIHRGRGFGKKRYSSINMTNDKSPNGSVPSAPPDVKGLEWVLARLQLPFKALSLYFTHETDPYLRFLAFISVVLCGGLMAVGISGGHALQFGVVLLFLVILMQARGYCKKPRRKRTGRR